MPRPDKNRSFTLTELLVSIAILFVVIGMTYNFGLPALMRLVDPRSEMVIAGEVNDTVAWLQSAIMRSLGTGNDFTLTVENQDPKDFLVIKWKTSGQLEKWSSNRIAFRSLNYNSRNSTYTSGFQKLSPAVTIQVHYGDGRKDKTSWRISISAYGYVRAFRHS